MKENNTTLAQAGTASRPIDLFLSLVGDYKKTANGYECRCPAHDDRTASLSIAEGEDGRVLVKCHAGCTTTRDRPGPSTTAIWLPLAKVLGVHADGLIEQFPLLVAVVVGCDDPPTFLLVFSRAWLPRWHQIGGCLSYAFADKGVPRVPYQLPRLIAEPMRPVVVAEGEKDVDKLAGIGVLATCNAGGAGKWTAAESECLRGRHVVILPDNDAPGRSHAESVARSLHGIAASVRIVHLPGLPPKGDVSDWIDAGGTREELRSLAVAAPEWVPSTEKKEESPTEIIQNFYMIGEDEYLPRPMVDIIRDMREKTDNWPRRIDTSLFVDDEKHGISWLSQPPDLFGWLASHVGRVDWRSGTGFVKQAEAFSEFRRTATSYLAIEELPHEPRLDRHYYRCGTYQPGNGDTLRALLDRFCPLTATDRDLLLAAIVTPCWGGPAGARPAFQVTSPFGRGQGKTATIKAIGRLWCGVLSFASGDDTAKMQTRLLSPDALSRRIAILDNVKAMKFSWAAWEAMLTAETIGGHRLYQGEATRPNLLTWFITVNGSSLSTDIAQRVVTISLDRPSRSGTWEEDTAKFIDDNRDALIADCIGFLRGGNVTPLKKFSRWATWERDILQRLPNPNEAQRVILERQQTADVEADEAEIIEEYFGSRLDDLHYTPETSRVHIPSAIAAEWYSRATNERVSTVAASRKISQLIDEGRLPRIEKNKCCSWGRGLVWNGVGADPQDSVHTDIESRINHHSRPSQF